MKNSQELAEDNMKINRRMNLHLPQREQMKMGNISRFHHNSKVDINKYSIVEMESEMESEVDSEVDSVKSYSVEGKNNIKKINSENIFSEFNNDSPKNYLITPKY